MNEYSAMVTDVIDICEIKCDIDLGFGVWLRGQTIFLKDIEPKSYDTEYLLSARKRLKSMIINTKVQLKSFPIRDSSGDIIAWSAVIHSRKISQISINNRLLNEGYASPIR